MELLVVIEKTSTGFSAYLPDIDGCVATGKTEKGALQNIRAALKLHFEGIEMNSKNFPKSLSHSHYIDIDIHNDSSASSKNRSVAVAEKAR